MLVIPARCHNGKQDNLEVLCWSSQLGVTAEKKDNLELPVVMILFDLSSLLLILCRGEANCAIRGRLGVTLVDSEH